MRLLAAFLMAVGMVMLSSSVPETVSASDCGYEECTSVGEEEECVWVSRPCVPTPDPDPPSNDPDARGGTVYTNNDCDSDGPCPTDGGGGGGSQTGQCDLPQGC